MDKNIAIPISGPSANDIACFKSIHYKPIIEMNRNKKISTKQNLNYSRLRNFCKHFLAFLFISLLLFTVFNNQEEMETDGDGMNEEMVVLDKTNICQFEEAKVDSANVSLTYTINEILRCLSKKLSDISTKKPVKNRPQQTPGSLPSQRPFFRTNDIIAG